MSDSDDNALLNAWRTAWYDAGWDPVVLTSDDARRRPDYVELDSMLKMGKRGFKFGEYDYMCFVRWIAMAAPPPELPSASAGKDGGEVDAAPQGGSGDGGGWMSDYDAFPLLRFTEEGNEDNLPNGGRLTVHESNGRNHESVVPSLVSGTADEWTRMAHLLVENYSEHMKEKEFWSDMLALDDLGFSTLQEYVSGDEGCEVGSAHDEEEETEPFWPFETRDAVIEAKDLLKGDKWQDKSDCRKSKRKRAVHFSHDSLAHAVLRPGESLGDHGDLALRWLKWWKRRCRV